MYYFLILSFLYSFINCELLQVDLPFCTVSLDKPILYDKMCQNLHSVITSRKLFNETIDVEKYITMSIFTKLQQEVYGMGMECSKSKTKWIFRKTFLGEYYKSDETSYIKLSRNECYEMKLKKICSTKDNGEIVKLECNGDVCSTEEKVFEPVFYSSGWWGDSSSETYSCQIVPKLITAVHRSDHIFGTDCIPSNLECHLPRSTIVWDKSIVMDCPFRPLLLDIRMKYVKISNNDEMFISQDTQARWAFKLKEMVTECGRALIKTTEGLYLAPKTYMFEKTADATMETTLYDDKSEMGIKLANDDFNIIEEKEIENELLIKECRLLQNAIQLFSFQQNKFFKVTDMKNSVLILYARNFQIFKPDCQRISSILINEKSFKCYEDFPIEFNYTTPDRNITRKINGFLTMNGVIKSVGKEIACNDETTYMNIENSSISLRKLNNFYKVFHNLSYNQLNVHFAKYEPMLDHNELLVNGVDYLKQMVGINKVVEINGLYSVMKPILPLLDYKEDHFSLKNLIGNIVMWAIITLLVLAFAYGIFKVIQCCIYMKNKSIKNKRYNDLRKCVEYMKKKQKAEIKTDEIELV